MAKAGAPPPSIKALIPETLQNNKPGIKTLNEKSRPGLDQVQT